MGGITLFTAPSTLYIIAKVEDVRALFIIAYSAVQSKINNKRN